MTELSRRANFRASVALIAVVLATHFLSTYLHEYWVRALVNGPEPTWGWWSPGWLFLSWGWELLVALIAAFGLALLLPAGSKFGWYVGLGIVLAGVPLLRLFMSGTLTPPTVDIPFSIWHYGLYLMSVVGATLGGAIAVALRTWRHRKPA